MFTKGLLGTRTSHYEISGIISETAKSEVYKAVDVQTATKYALKIFRHGKISQESIVKEIEIMNSIKHPNIMPIKEVISEGNNNLRIIMPRAIIDLLTYVETRSTFDECNASRVIYSVLNALSYLHSMNIIHRNVKLDNILIMKEESSGIDVNNVVLSGFSCFTSKLGEMPSDFDVEGFQFSSPEILQHKEYDEKTDIWSVGIVTYACLYGKYPFDSEEIGEYLKSILSGEIIYDKSHEISNEAQEFISSLLKVNPLERLSAEEALNHPWIKKNINSYDASKPFMKDISEEYESAIKEENKMNEIIQLQSNSSQKEINIKKLRKVEKIRENKYYREYKVEDKSTGNLYSAKCFYQNIDDYPYEQRKQIRRILRKNRELNHPSIVKNIKIFENGFQNESYTTLLTEYQHLRSLEELNKNELTTTQKHIIAYGIASAMSYLHKHSILHRELSNSNIFVDDNFYPKVDNIGIYDNINSIEQIRKIINVGFFFAPEYYETNEYTEKSEVYSYGFVLYSLFSKTKIEEEINIKEILNNILLHKEPTINNEISIKYRQLIEKCFCQDPSERPRFEEICEELEDNSEFQELDIEYEKLQQYIRNIKSAKDNQDSYKSQRKEDNDNDNDPKQKSKSKSESKQETNQKSKFDDDDEIQYEKNKYSKYEDEEEEEEEEEKKEEKEEEEEEEEEEKESNDNVEDDEKKKRKENERKVNEILSNNNVKQINLKQYKLKERLGEGISCNVYKAIPKSKKELKAGAAKIFNTDILRFDNNQDVINFINETTFLSKMNHPLIVKFYGYSLHNFKNQINKDLQVIMTEYAENGTLYSIIKKYTEGPNSSANTVDTKKLIIIYGIALSMSYLHSLNYLHRDIKPLNILIDKQYHPILADFGLYVQIKEDEKIIENTPIGTAPYIAPEIWIDGAYSKSSDVYAFGIAIYELISETFFLEDAMTANILYRIAYQKERPHIDKKIPTAYKKLINSCTSFDERKRPTFEKIVDMLKNDSAFITENVDEESYRKYIQMIEDQFKKETK